MVSAELRGDGDGRAVLVTCIVVTFVAVFVMVSVLWLEAVSTGKGSGSPRVLLDFLAQHSATTLHDDHHTWIPPNPTTASEKAEAKAGLRDLVARHQKSVGETSTMFQLLMVKVLAAVMVDEITIRKRIGAHCLINGSNPKERWPELIEDVCATLLPASHYQPPPPLVSSVIC